MTSRGGDSSAALADPPETDAAAFVPDFEPETTPPPAVEEGEFDYEFETAFAGASGSAEGGTTDGGANRELFVGIAARQTGPVKDFIRQLRTGPATKDWIGICRPVLGSTLEAAQGIDLDDVAARIADLDEALGLAAAEDGNLVEDTTRDLVLACFEELEAALPEAFGLDGTDGRRETIAVHALLRQIPEVGHVTLEKLYAAGFTSLAVLVQASPEDLAVTTGINPTISHAIAERVREHRSWRDSLPTDGEDAALRGRLAEHVAELRRCEESYARAAEAEVRDAAFVDEKRETRRERQAAELRVELILAEMNQLELLERTQKVPIERRIGMLEEFLG